MGTFKAYFNKEILESKRHFRYIVVFLAFIFLALLDPITTKLMPSILESSGIKNASQIAGLVMTDKLQIMGNLIMKEFTQMGVLIVVFVFCNILSDELTSQKFVFPFSKGAEASSIILAKTLHYSLVIIAAIAIAIFTNYYYVDIIFTDGQVPAVTAVLFSILLVSLFFIFTFMLTMLLSLLFKRGIAAGIIAALIQFLSTIPSQITSIKDFIPFNLLSAASKYEVTNMTVPILTVLAYIIILVFVNITLLKKKEIMQ
ncbi:MAG: hypothetical protein Q8930_11315 [Bacillota bacterium]|nr:hypothetical protein [Bacillota bacterium]